MNRIYKFRAWDKEKKKMEYAEDSEDLNNWFSNIPASKGGFNEFVDCYELMQFTGLLDKNGKEIYEGDIVKSASFDYRGEPNFKTTQVIWVDGGFSYKDTEYDYDGLLYPEDWEVIGNIYENPDLIPNN